MQHFSLQQSLADAKHNLSCVELLNSLGFHCRHAQAISAPLFIRSDDRNPSFGVYHSSCKDFATGKLYDVFDLYMLAHNCSLPEAYQALTGQPLFHTHDQQHNIPHALRNFISNDYSFSSRTNSPLLSQLLPSLNISTQQAHSFRLGWNSKLHALSVPANHFNYIQSILKDSGLNVVEQGLPEVDALNADPLVQLHSQQHAPLNSETPNVAEQEHVNSTTSQRTPLNTETPNVARRLSAILADAGLNSDNINQLHLGWNSQLLAVSAPQDTISHSRELLKDSGLSVVEQGLPEIDDLLTDPRVSLNVHITSQFLAKFGISRDDTQRLQLGFSATSRTFFTTTQHLDELSLLLKNSGFSVKDYSDYSELDDTLAIAQQQLDNDINVWHHYLLNDPIVNYKGKDLHLVSEYLKGRGISPETANKLMLGYNPATRRLVFPLFKGNRVCYFIGRDMTGRCENSYKYVKAKKDDSIAYVSTFWGRETLRKPGSKTQISITGQDGEVYTFDDDNPRDDTLIITEGMLDYASFYQDGWQVLSPGGGFFSQNDQRELLEIASTFKRVCLCFDNDNAGTLFTRKLASLFLEHRVHFVIAHTSNPDGSDSKFDINDYYSHGGNLQTLVKQAKNGIAEFISSFDNEDDVYNYLEKASRWISPVDMSRLQLELLHAVKPNTDFNPDDDTDSQFVPKFDKLTLKHIFREIAKPSPEKAIAHEVLDHHHIIYNYNDSFYEFAQGHWQAVPDERIFQFASDRIGKRARAGQCRSIITHLKGIAGDWAQFDTQHVIAFKNGVLDLETGKFHSHDPKFMNTIILDYPYVPTAPCRKWRRFISQITKDKPELVRQLMKAAGYVLFADNSLQKMFALFGTGANGKSVFTGVLEQVFGSRNTSNVRPDRLSNEFDPHHLKGKLLNICYEAKRSLSGAEETLKAVVSGDPIMAAHKGIDAETFTSRAKWFINLNDVLETTDISWGFLRRLIFLPFTQTFNGDKANTNLTNELLEELPGIFNWCYEGYKLLRKDMKFEDLQDATRILEQMMSRVNNCFSFFCDSFRYNANEFLKDGFEMAHYPHEREIFDYYKSWCVDNNEKPTTRKLFLEHFRVFIQKYRPDVVIGEPLSVEGLRGKVSTYYFPELVVTDEQDYFADVRDHNHRVPGQEGYKREDGTTDRAPKVDTDELMEEMQRIDTEGAPQPEQLDPKAIQRAADIEEGRKIFQECVVDKRWARRMWRPEWDRPSFEFAKLCAYLGEHPEKADELYNFKQTYREILGIAWKGHTSAH